MKEKKKKRKKEKKKKTLRMDKGRMSQPQITLNNGTQSKVGIEFENLLVPDRRV
jgi:hypothetical protein